MRWISLVPSPMDIEPRVAVHALDLELAAVAVAAMNLDGVAADALAHFGGEQLGHAGSRGEVACRWSLSQAA